VFGPDPRANPVQFYFNPIRIQSLCLSAVELGQATADMNISHLEHMSAQVNFVLRSNPTDQNMVVPLIQGSGFISAIYTNLTPRFDSGIMFRGQPSVINCQNMQKWRIQTKDGHIWLLYALPFFHDRPLANLVRKSRSRLEFDIPFTGWVQLTKLPSGDNSFEAITDKCAGTWATTASLSASCEDTQIFATYTFDYRLHPNSRSKNLLMYALPHHVDSFIPETAEVYSQYRLDSTTKGPMCAVVSDCWQLREQLPHHISFCPDSIAVQHEPSRHILAHVAREEAQGNPVEESNQPSMYFSGKTLDKYACICWVICAVLEDVELAQNLLKRVKQAFSRFTENRQRFPLVYESEIIRIFENHKSDLDIEAWGGLVSSAMYETGDLMQDFGNGCYSM
jgi:endo-1,3(4)-beta-glucanase